MPSNDEPVNNELKQYVLYTVMMINWIMKWNNINLDQKLWTIEASSETIQTMPCNDGPMMYEVKQYKHRPVMMN